MSKRARFAAAAAGIIMMIPLSLGAEIIIRADMVSRYIWQGFDLNPYRNPALQPSLDFSLNDTGLKLRLWSSLSFENKEVHEMRAALSYTASLTDRFSMEGGVIHYGWYFTPDFRFGDDTSHEIYLAGSFTWSGMESGLTAFYDFTNGDGYYLRAEAAYSHQVTARWSARFQASLGYNGGQWLAEGVDSGFSDLNLGITLPLRFERIKIAPFAGFTRVLLDAIGKRSHFIFGISTAFSPSRSGR